MKREDLTALGIPDENVDKIMSMNGRDIEKHKTAAETAQGQVTTLTGQLADRDKQLEDLKKVDAAALQNEITRLQGENTTAKQNYESSLAAMRLDHALDTAIIGAGGKNAKAIKALLPVDKLKLKNDGSVDGLDLEALKTSDPYLFAAVETKRHGTGGSGGTDDNPSDDTPPEDYEDYKAWREKH